MKSRAKLGLIFGLIVPIVGVSLMMAQQTAEGSATLPHRPEGPCDIYAAAGDACVAAHSTTRALYASYNGPLYQVMRQSDGKTLNINVVQPSASDAGGYADAAAQGAFCANTYCWITTIFDQSPKHNDLTQAPRGGFSGPAMGGFNNLPIADMAPITVLGHKVYGVFIEPGMGLRNDDPKGTAVDDQAEGQYWVVNGLHFNGGCCFDYGNMEIDSRDDDDGTMEATYYGDNAGPWFHGKGAGPWVMTDQENNLVGCVNPNGSKTCENLPTITWRFVTGIAKGEPHHWTSMAGDARKGPLAVMFSGPRINATYDPMRKQGAIGLGNGGDNSNGSQGTFYEGAMTAAGTFPTDDTDQLVQANIVAAGYNVAPVAVAPADAKDTPPGLQTFSPGSSQETTVTFTNTTGASVQDVNLSLSVPGTKWTSFVQGTRETSQTIAGPIAPGASVSATFRVTSGPAPLNGDLVGRATWRSNGGKESGTAAEKVRNVSPVKINEFRISTGQPANMTNSFIELYNAGTHSVDISNWTLTARPTQQASFSAVEIPSGTKLAAGGFYLLGLSNSGLAAPTGAGDATIHVRSTDGMSVGDTLSIGSGSYAETRKIASLGTAAGVHTTLWQPLPDGPIITVPAGSTNVPVKSTSGFVVGQKIGLGYGAEYPVAARTLEQYEVATVTAVGKPGTQAYLAADAKAGETNIKVTAVEDISVGDKIRLDIDSVDHGIETVTVTHIGTPAIRAHLASDVKPGATRIEVRGGRGLSTGDKITIGTPANRQVVTIEAVHPDHRDMFGIEITPALDGAHIGGEDVVEPGTGLELEAPLKFNHAANLPFSDRGTGISFEPATSFAHSSNEPVQPLGTGITLDKPLSKGHAVNTVVRDVAVTTAGYQGTPKPNQWFGGPELTSNVPFFDHLVTLREGSMVLRDASGLVVDSLNYGGLADPWAAEGYQATSGPHESGCYVAAPGLVSGERPRESGNTSAGRLPDGHDTDSNCTDFVTAPATVLAASSAAGATDLKVAGVKGFSAGQTIRIGAGPTSETAEITAVGTSGATAVRDATDAGATLLPVANTEGFREGQTITVGSGADAEMAVIASIRRFGDKAIMVSAPLTHAHAANSQISGTGITLAAPLAREHSSGSPVEGNAATPGAPNQYSKSSR